MTLAKPFNKRVNGKYGAPMGRINTQGRGDKVARVILFSPVPLHDGCYDRGGAYWGMPSNLYCFYTSAGGAYYTRTWQSSDLSCAMLGAMDFFNIDKVKGARSGKIYTRESLAACMT